MIKQRKLPYQGTKVDPETTMAEIGKMLRTFGIDDFQWTTLWTEDLVELKFGIRTKDNKMISVRMVPPVLKTTKRVYDEKLKRVVSKEIPSWPQAMRLLLYYIKSKLEAVAFGLRTFNEEFLADLIVRGPAGQETTVAAILIPRLEATDYKVAALGPGPDEE